MTDQKTNPEQSPIIGYQMPAEVYAAMMQKLQALPYSQVASVMEACRAHVTPIHAEILDNHTIDNHTQGDE